MSLTRALDARIERRGRWIFARCRVHLTRTRSVEIARGAYAAACARLAAEGAAPLLRDGDRVLWWTGAGCYWAEPELDAEAVALLVWDRGRRQDARLDRLRRIRAREQQVEDGRRARIPEEVRAFVWERDGGRCVRCDAEEDLQFDHVIPVARGGGSAVDNIQILCGDCNRLKSDAIA